MHSRVCAPTNRAAVRRHQRAADGSLTICVQEPKEPVERADWLPSPKNAEFSLYVRAYWPDDAITHGRWTPPAVVKVR